MAQVDGPAGVPGSAAVVAEAEAQQRRTVPGAEALELERLLREVSSTMRRQGRRALISRGVTRAQFDALVHLGRAPLTMGRLCGKLGLASSTVTDLIDRMERDDFVQRRRDQDDRRVIWLHVSTRGREVLDDVLRARAAYLGEILARLPEPEAAEIEGAIRLLHEQMTGPEAPRVSCPEGNAAGASCGS